MSILKQRVVGILERSVEKGGDTTAAAGCSCHGSVMINEYSCLCKIMHFLTLTEIPIN